MPTFEGLFLVIPGLSAERLPGATDRMLWKFSDRGQARTMLAESLVFVTCGPG
jgi:hypothetical protein